MYELIWKGHIHHKVRKARYTMMDIEQSHLCNFEKCAHLQIQSGHESIHNKLSEVDYSGMGSG